ncbi:MAG: hypothetical protein R3321_10400 [Nitrososphaeraceae archaeon]|nr:hypothetical protein [Nitrososphaeraceae archaeon]
MDYKFCFHNTYKIEKSLEQLKISLEDLNKKKWYDFGINLKVELIGKRRFEFTPKISLGIINVMGLSQDFALVYGEMREQDGQTCIELESRPNYALVFIFYCALFFPIIKYYYPSSFQSFEINSALILSSVTLPILFIMMIIPTLILRSRVERFLGLSRF